MNKYIKEFINDLEKKIKEKHKFTQEEISFIKTKISNFQHERLIHLLVTLFFVIFALFFLVLSMVCTAFLIPFLFVIIFLLFYIKHYFFLENSIQYIYKLYDKVLMFTLK